MHRYSLRRPPLWRLLLPAITFAAIAAFGLVTETVPVYRQDRGWTRLPSCADAFHFWATVLFSLEAALLFTAASVIRVPDAEAILRRRPGLWFLLAVVLLGSAVGVASAVAGILTGGST